MSPEKTEKSATGQTAQAQVRRLLSLIPYLRQHDGASIADVAEAFGVPPKRIREDLNVLWMCGLPGLSPGDLIDIDMDAVDGEGVIHLSNADYLTRPLRLSADEALALILALRTLRGVTATGDRDAIDRALAKLESVAAEGPDRVAGQAEVAVTGGGEDTRATVTEALRRGKRLELTYDVASRAETTHRFVDPLRVFVLEGYGYLDALCYLANAVRSFRLDRIASIRITDTDVAEHQVQLRDVTKGWFDALKDAPLVTLALDRAAAWVAEYYPMESVTPADDGGLTVTTRVSDPAWLRGLLLRLGGGAQVLSPEDAGDSAADAASEALDQYAALAG
ncbi:protein pafC [Microlunatus endophyticus]|uniref:Protein pafC n=1 Tax=Microlunatus endophyticus TaxID=1716077 RepID=A0A917W190_9ACTN|nr:WYL domain-containing protein [Microlunatus endophyticus]GGL49889.1 protein pafC [Microlunatus endophyticus]